MKIIVGKDGVVRIIYSDELIGLLNQGEATIRRASHVEPCEGGWSADMKPVNGPILGPFTLKQDALDAEVEWLNKNNIPIPV